MSSTPIGPVLNANNIRTDEIPPKELVEICEEINRRNLGQNTELSEFATPDNAAIKQKQESERNGDTALLQLDFERDIRRIIYTREYERLQKKTQVCTSPTNDDITNRATHTQRVASISRAMAKRLGANLDLAEAIAQGHDIGHAPFGHRGEDLLTQISFDRDIIGKLGVFKHNIQSVNVVDRIAERPGISTRGLNLTDQVRHGILSHDGEKNKWSQSPERCAPEVLHQKIVEYMKKVIEASNPDNPQQTIKEIKAKVAGVTIKPATLEACIVFIADVLHYMPEDFEDMITLEVVQRTQLPIPIAQVIGNNSGDMINNLFTDVVVHSYGQDGVGYSNKYAEALDKFKNEFLYPRYYQVNSMLESFARDKRVGLNPGNFPLDDRMAYLFDKYLLALEDGSKLPNSSIQAKYLKNRDLTKYLKQMSLIDEDAKAQQIVIDYIAGFTDRRFFEESDQMGQ